MLLGLQSVGVWLYVSLYLAYRFVVTLFRLLFFYLMTIIFFSDIAGRSSTLPPVVLVRAMYIGVVFS